MKSHRLRPLVAPENRFSDLVLTSPPFACIKTNVVLPLTCLFIFLGAVSAAAATVPAEAGVAGSSPVVSAIQTGPEIDHFYLELLEDGEKAFLADEFGESAASLEVAAFGLTRNAGLLLKAYLYLAVSWYELRNFEKSRTVLADAAGIIKTGREADLAVDGKTRQAVVAVARALQVNLPLPEPETDSAGPKPGTHMTAVNNRPTEVRAETPLKKVEVKAPSAVLSEIEVLQSTLKNDPGNTQAAFKLCSVHFDQKRYKEARKILRDLASNNPREIRAMMLLIRAEYSLGNHSEAMSLIRRLTGPSSGFELSREEELKTSVYAALCLKAMNQKRSSLSFYDRAAGNMVPEELKKLLEEEDLAEDWEALKASLGLRQFPVG